MFFRRASDDLGVEESTKCDDPDAVRGGVDAALAEKVEVFTDLPVKSR